MNLQNTLALFALAVVLPAAALAAQQFERWESEIRKFEEADRASPPDPGGVVFVGSSSIRMWNLEKYFPDLDGPVANRAFGGSTIADSVHFFDRIVAPRRPRAIVLYAGDNDIASGMTPDAVFADFLAFVRKAESAVPDARIVWIPIKPSRARWDRWPDMNLVNAMVKGFAAASARVAVADTAAPMLAAAPEPASPPPDDLFLDDGLHLSEKGYQLWSDVVRETLAQTLKP